MFSMMLEVLVKTILKCSLIISILNATSTFVKIIYSSTLATYTSWQHRCGRRRLGQRLAASLPAETALAVAAARKRASQAPPAGDQTSGKRHIYEPVT